VSETPARTIRIGATLWGALGAAGALVGRNRSWVLRALIRALIRAVNTARRKAAEAGENPEEAAKSAILDILDMARDLK
jgi:hypothetical protein